MKVKKLLDIAAGKKLPHAGLQRVPGARWASARQDYLDPRGGQEPFGRRGEAHRDRHASWRSDPKLAIYDEPEAGIDLWSFDRLTETFRDIHEARDGRSIVIISHQERIIQLADEIVLLRDGHVEETGTPDELLPKLGFVAKGIPGCQLTEPTELHLTEIATTC